VVIGGFVKSDNSRSAASNNKLLQSSDIKLLHNVRSSNVSLLTIIHDGIIYISSILKSLTV
jgi:hypothetical protein